MNSAIRNPKSAVPIRAFQWDLARQAERLDWLLAQLPRYADWGYTELYLHLEDSVVYPSLPGVARPGAYSHRDMQRLVDAAGRAGIGVVPIVNLLGHTQYLIKVPALRDLNELRAPDGSPLERGQVCPVHPRMLEVADKLLRDTAPWCTAGKVHVGLDESFHLGRHPLSRRDIARHGLDGHFARHVQRLHGLAQARGLRLGMWADMLYFLPGAIRQLPPGIAAYDWYYHPFARHPRVEIFNFAERDLAAPLKARGIEYWGCPMNGAFRHEPLPVFGDRLANIRSWWGRCRRTGAAGMLVTSWESSRLAMELTPAVDAAAASLWLDPVPGSGEAMLARGFARAFGAAPGPARTAARTALAADRFPFSGYARWETNDRWDTGAGGLARAEAEFGEIDALEHASRGLPAPLTASLAFRRYLAARDVFVRKNAAAILKLRRWLHVPVPSPGRIRRTLDSLAAEAKQFSAAHWVGCRAARRMWSATREADPEAPNERQLHEDARRLHAWQHWLIHAREHPAMIRLDTPFVGAWQLTFTVHNFAPALQKVIVEEKDPGGTWREIRGRFTIEFQAAAAQPRTAIAREFSVPVRAAGTQLRLAVRGVGQVKIGGVTLTDGVTTLSPRGWPAGRKKLLGLPAPSRGLPALDWEKNNAVLALVFARN